VSFLTFAQKTSQKYYDEDESFHKNEIKKNIKNYKKEYKELIYISSLNYSFNRTVFLFINGNDIKVYSIKNEKFTKKIVSKKIKLNKRKENQLIEFIKKPNTKISNSDCFKEDTVTHYKIEFFINGKVIKTSSRCIKAISKNKLLNELLVM